MKNVTPEFRIQVHSSRYVDGGAKLVDTWITIASAHDERTAFIKLAHEKEFNRNPLRLQRKFNGHYRTVN